MPTFLMLDAAVEGWPVIACSERVLHLTGYDRGALVGRPWPQLWDEDEQREQVEVLRASIAARRRVHVDIPTVRHDQPALPTTVTVEPAIGLGDTLVVVSIAQQARDQRWLAFHDALTGLPNRSLLDRDLDVAIDRAARMDSAVAVLYVDLDGFKPVNDALGHRAGDVVLQTVADRLRRCTRAHDLVVRLGGDEFVLVLTDVARPGRAQAQAVAANVREAISAPIDIGGTRAAVTASVGVGIFPDDGSGAADLVARADARMYREKGGRGEDAVDAPAARKAVLQRAAMAQARATALRFTTERNLKASDEGKVARRRRSSQT